MAFFDNLTRKAQDVASVAGEKAKMAADTAKINMQIASEQREIEKDYKTIGEWYMAEHADEARRPLPTWWLPSRLPRRKS